MIQNIIQNIPISDSLNKHLPIVLVNYVSRFNTDVIVSLPHMK